MNIPAAHASNVDQATYWNGPSGRRWIDRQEMQDGILAPVAERLLKSAGAAPGDRVIDIGCGCGATTLEIARRVGPAGGAIGVDVSAPMLERARERMLPGAEFLLADAMTHPFAPGAADLVLSRFGVMFFADPARVQRILAAAGFAEIVLTPVDFDLDLAAGEGFEAGLTTAQEIGAASRALEGQPEALRAAAAEEIRAALAPYQRGQSLPLGAAIWIVSAKA